MAGPFDLTGQNIENTYQRVLQTPDGATFYDGTGSLVTLPSANTASLLITASVNLNTITFTKGNTDQFSITVNTGSGGTTAVTGSNITQSFSNTATWTFIHNLGTRVPIITVFDTNYKQIIPQDIELVNTNSATITFPTAESGFAIASLGGAINNITSASYASTASYYAETDPVFVAKSASLATTGSNIFRGNQTVTGSLFTSGSNTLIGDTILSGSIGISGSSTIQGTTTMTGSLVITGSTTQVGNNTLFGNNTLTGSNAISGSNTIIGGNLIIGGATITGSLSITGSTTQTGNNTLIGTTTLTGSILISGDVIPTISSSFNLGSETNPWKSIYLQSGSISIRSDIPGGPDAVISNTNGNVSIIAAGFQIKSGSVIPFQIDTTGRTSLTVPVIPAGDIGAFSIVGNTANSYQPVTSPGGMVHITGNDGQANRFNMDSFGSGSTASFNGIIGRAARGTAASPSQSKAGDVVLRLTSTGWRGDTGFGGTTIVGGSTTTLDFINLEDQMNDTRGSAQQFYNAPVGTRNRVLSAQIDATGITIPSSSRLFGTASWALNTLTASFSQTASYVNTLTQTVTITGSLRISGSGFINGLPILTSANTSSFTDGFGWYGAFCSTGSQTNPVGNVSRSMQLDTTEHSNGISLVGGSRITFAHTGVYNIQFSAQLQSTSAGDNLVNIWFKKNGSNVARSNTLINVAKQAGDKVVAAWNYVDTANANDYYEIVWQAADTHMELHAAAATGNIPSTPSVIVTATQVG